MRFLTSMLTFGDFVFDPQSRLLKREGVEVPLPPRVLGVLELLLTRAGEIVPRRELMETVWKDAFVTDTSLAEAISFLRQALGDDPQSPRYIQTVHRRGYRFLATVASPESVASPALPGLETGPPGDNGTNEPTVSYDLFAWSIAVLSLIGGVSAMWYATRQAPVDPPVVQLLVEAGEGRVFDQRAPAIAISNRADTVAWSACDRQDCQLFVRTIGSVSARPLDGTAGASAPFFAPDGRWVGFFADGKLKKVLVQGGPPIVIADAPQPGGAAWMRDGYIVFAASVAGGLLRVSDGGGPVERITQPATAQGELRHMSPSAAGDGALTYLAVTSAVSGAPGRLMLLPYGPPWDRPGHVLIDNVAAGALVGEEFVTYVRGQELFAQPYHAAKEETAGGEQVVGTGVLAPHLAVSLSGALVVATASSPSSDTPVRWRWGGRDSRSQAPSVPALLDAVLSPTGSRLAGIAPDSATQLWTADLTRGTTTRLTHAARAASPTWAPDGSAVWYASMRANRYEIWTRDASANGDERQFLARDDRHLFPASADARRLAYVETGGSDGADIGLVDRANGTPQLVGHTRFDEIAPALSPDGRRLAYQSDESGQWEVVVLDFRTGRRSPVSTTGGSRPFWSLDGRTLYFESRGSVLRALIGDGGELAAHAAVVHTLQSERLIGVTPDGTLLLERDPHPPAARAILTLEWIRELRRVVGPPPVPLPR